MEEVVKNILNNRTMGFNPVNFPPFSKPDTCPFFEALATIAEEFFDIKPEELKKAKNFCGRYHIDSRSNDNSGEFNQETTCLRLYYAIQEVVELVKEFEKIAHFSKEDNLVITIKTDHLLEPVDEQREGQFQVDYSRIASSYKAIIAFIAKHPEIDNTESIMASGQAANIMQRKFEEFRALLFEETGSFPDIVVSDQKCPNAPSWGGRN